MKLCEKCNKNQVMSTSKRFCSRSCANSRKISTETKLKIAESLKTNVPHNAGKQTAHRVSVSCVVCSKVRSVLPSKSHVKTCSKECLNKLQKMTYGGNRPGAGRAKTGYYKGVYCGSTYELVWVMYNIHHNIDFTRCDKTFKYDGTRTYYPDFILDGDIIEIKGYVTDEVLLKAQAVRDNGLNIKILTKKELEYAFSWFKTKYPGKTLIEMYD